PALDAAGQASGACEYSVSARSPSPTLHGGGGRSLGSRSAIAKRRSGGLRRQGHAAELVVLQLAGGGRDGGELGVLAGDAAGGDAVAEGALELRVELEAGALEVGVRLHGGGLGGGGPGQVDVDVEEGEAAVVLEDRVAH